MIVLLLLSLSVVFGVTGGEVGSPAGENCEASCPDEGERPWPPEGFVEDEIAVRCSLSCLQDEMQVGNSNNKFNTIPTEVTP